MLQPCSLKSPFCTASWLTALSTTLPLGGMLMMQHTLQWRIAVQLSPASMCTRPARYHPPVHAAPCPLMSRRPSQSLSHGAEYDAEEGGAAAGVATLLALPAAQRGLASVIYLLHEFGGTMEKQDMDRGGPPLMHAANNGHASTVTALLKVRLKPGLCTFCCLCSVCLLQPVLAAGRGCLQRHPWL